MTTQEFTETVEKFRREFEGAPIKYNVDEGFIYIVAEWSGSVADAARHLNNFDEWWIDQPSMRNGNFCFTYELI